jgi:hypothetical protein
MSIQASRLSVRALLVQELKQRKHEASWEESWLSVDKIRVNVSIHEECLGYRGKTGHLVCEFARVMDYEHRAALKAQAFKYSKTREATYGLDIKKIADRVEKWLEVSATERQKSKTKEKAENEGFETVKRLQKKYPTAAGKMHLSVRDKGIEVRGIFDEKTIEALYLFLEGA